MLSRWARDTRKYPKNLRFPVKNHVGRIELFPLISHGKISLLICLQRTRFGSFLRDCPGGGGQVVRCASTFHTLHHHAKVIKSQTKKIGPTRTVTCLLLQEGIAVKIISLRSGPLGHSLTVAALHHRLHEIVCLSVRHRLRFV